MLNVGELAALLNVLALLSLLLIERLPSLSVRNFTAATLHRRGRAPVLHDTDTSIWGVPRALFKFRKHPVVLFTIVCTIALFPAEMVIELGVDPSQKCRPKQLTANVIAAGDLQGKSTDVEIGASAAYIQGVRFQDDLQRVPKGFPKHFNETLCLSEKCFPIRTYPSLTANCTVTKLPSFHPGSVYITLKRDSDAFGTTTSSFLLRNGTEYIGDGDVTGNVLGRGAFLVVGERWSALSNSLLYMEYTHQRHLLALYRKTRTLPKKPVQGWTSGPVHVHRIHCGTNELSSDSFRKVVMIYRTIQLENQIFVMKINESTKAYPPPTPADVYKAVLSGKISEDNDEQGSYLVYTSCAQYNSTFLVPFVVLYCVVIALTIISRYVSPPMRHVIPYTSRTWFRRARLLEAQRSEEDDVKPRQGIVGRYFCDGTDEMVLVNDPVGSRIEVCSVSQRTPAAQRHDAALPASALTPNFDADCVQERSLSGVGLAEDIAAVRSARGNVQSNQARLGPYLVYNDATRARLDVESGPPVATFREYNGNGRWENRASN